MEKVVNEEKRQKFMEFAGKRVNNVLHDIQILEPMARSNSYDFTRKDVEDMFNAMQETLNEAKEEFNRKFDEKARAEKKVFSFSSNINQENNATNVSMPVSNVENVENAENVKVENNSNLGSNSNVITEIQNDQVSESSEFDAHTDDYYISNSEEAELNF